MRAGRGPTKLRSALAVVARGVSALGAVALLCASPVAFSASTGGATVILNESPAYKCYQAALRRDETFGLDDCDRAIELQGLTRRDLASTHSNRGLLLGRAGDLGAALKDHNRALELAPELASAWINRANLHLRQRAFAAALEDLDQAVSMASEQQHLAFYNRALLHERLGNLAAARADVERAMAVAPQPESYAEFLKRLPRQTPLIPARPPEPSP